MNFQLKICEVCLNEFLNDVDYNIHRKLILLPAALCNDCHKNIFDLIITIIKNKSTNVTITYKND